MNIKEFILDTIADELSLLDKSDIYDIRSEKDKLTDILDEDIIIGGVGDYTVINDVNPFQLAVGVLVEMEHTNDKNQALEISKDHLTEHSLYYDKLINSGLVDEKDAIDLHNKLNKINTRLLKYNKVLQQNNYDKEKLDGFIKSDMDKLTYLIPYNFSDFMQHDLFKTKDYKEVFNYIKKQLT